MKNVVLLAICLFLNSLTESHCQPKGKIRIYIKEFSSVDGVVKIGLFVASDKFRISATDSAFKHKTITVKRFGMVVDFDDVPPGDYAVALYQDVNKNGKFNYLNEDYSISNGKTILIKTPSFNQSKFHYYGNDTIIKVYCDNEKIKLSKDIGSWTIAPIVSYSPETRLQGGVSTYRLFKFRPDTVTRTSFYDFFGMVTQNSQWTIHNNYLIFTPKEKYLITGLNWFQYFPQYYYGVGNDLSSTVKEQIKYNQLIIDCLVQRKIRSSLFAGLGYRFSTIYNMKAENGGLMDMNKVTGYQGSYVSGIQFGITSDNRDNIYYATKGHYLKLHLLVNAGLTGSPFEYRVYDIDYRKYIKVFKNRWDVLAFHGYGYFTDGDVPWNEMGTLGNSDIMRGYYSGRFRDKKYLAAQIEYRLVFNKLLGMVFFASVGEVGREFKDFNFNGLKPSGGTGFRLKVNRRDRLNFRIDAGLGLDGVNFYVGGSEAF